MGNKEPLKAFKAKEQHHQIRVFRLILRGQMESRSEAISPKAVIISQKRGNILNNYSISRVKEERVGIRNIQGLVIIPAFPPSHSKADGKRENIFKHESVTFVVEIR